MSNLKQFLQEAAGFTTNVNVPEVTKPSNHFADYMQEKKNQEIQAQEDRLKRVEQYGSDFAQIGDKVHERTTLGAVGDVSAGVTQGIWGTVTGGLGAYISPEALERMNSVSETLEGWKSEQTQVGIKAYMEETGKFNGLIEDAIMRGDISQYEGEVAILKNSLKSMNAAQIESVISQGVGSAAILIAAHATGNPVVISGAWGAMGASSLASPANTVLQELYAKDESGDFKLTHEDLMESSGKYTAYFEQTNDPIEARRRLFNYARNDAIWDAKNIGATAVEILGERALLKGAGLLRSTPKPPMFAPKEGGIIKNTVSGTTKFIGAGAVEATAESIGEAGSTISANQAMQSFADLENPTINPEEYRSLKGVGTVVADSIVGGAGTAGAVRSVGLAAKASGTVLETAALKEQEKVDALPENQAKKSMEELSKVNTDPEVEPDDHTETFKNIDNDFKWIDYQENEASNTVRETTGGSANYVEASQKIVNKILDETTSSEEIIELGSALSNIKQEIQQIVGNMAGALDSLEPTDPRMEHALNWINSINQVMNNTEANEAFTKAVEQAANIDAKIDENVPLSEQTQEVKNLKDKMTLNPESLTEAEVTSAKKVMEDVVNADTFSSQDRALINILEESITASKKIYGKSKEGVVQQVMFNEAAGEKGQSVVGHASDILKSANRGQFENIPEQMGIFKRWIDSHKSKLEALQRSKKDNNSPQTYITTSQNSTRPVEAAKPVTYSKKFNNMVQAELTFMENVYSQLENIVEPSKETSKPKTVEEASKPKAKQKQIDETDIDKARTAAINRVKVVKAEGQEALKEELVLRQAQLKEAKKGSQKEQALSYIVQALQQEIIPERKIEPKAKPEPVKVDKPTSTSHLSSQKSNLVPIENAVEQLKEVHNQVRQVQEIEDEINNNPDYDPTLEDQAVELDKKALAGLQKIGENLSVFAEDLPESSPMRHEINSINEAINSDESLEIVGAEVAQGLRNLRNIQNSTGDLFAEPNQEGQEGEASSIKLSGKSPYTAKDQRKADVATKFIGQGAPGSSTAIYAKDFGDLANTGNYTADDVVFVSTNGARKNRVPANLTELGKAVEAGATIVTDAPVDRDRSFNVGEREVAAFLSDKGYVETVDPTGIGIWTASKTTSPKSRNTQEKLLQEPEPVKEKKAEKKEKVKEKEVKKEPETLTPKEEAQELSKKLNELSQDEYKTLAQEVLDAYAYPKNLLTNILTNHIGEKTLEGAPLQQIDKIADNLISARTKKTEVKEETKTEEKVEPEVSNQKEKAEETIGKSSWFKNIKLREGVTNFWDMDKPVSTMVDFFKDKEGFQGLSTTLERMSKKVAQVSKGVTDVVNNRIDKIGFKYNQDNARQVKDFNTVTNGLMPYLNQETIDSVFAQDTATKAREFAKNALVDNGKTEQEAEAIIKDIQYKLAETRPSFRMSALMVDGVIPNEILAASTIAITNYFSGFSSNHASNELDTRDLIKFQKSIGFDKSEYDPDLDIVKIQNSNDPKAEPSHVNINTLVQQGFVTSRQARKAITTDVFRILGISPDAKNTEGSMYLPIENLIGTLLSNVMESHETNKMYMEVNTGVTDSKGKSLRTFIPVFMPPLRQNIKADYDTTGIVDTLIDSFMNEKEGARYINEMPTVSDRAKDGTKLSKSQYKAQKHQASIPFVINKNMDTVLTKVLGSDGIVEAFGEQLLTNMNNNDRAAKEGKNNQLVNSVEELNSLNNSIDLAGSNKEEAKIYYNFEVTSVLRSMMKGAYNPQASKVVRAAVSPNKVELDASSVLDDFGSLPYSDLSDAGKFLAIAYAQAFGVSVHNMNHEQNLQALNEIMTPELLGLSDSWFKHSQEGSKAPKELISKSKELLGNDWSELALQTLVEIGSLRNSKDPSKFITHAYIEADGITNGPFMAAMILGIDLTDSKWIQFAENGGLYIGQDINSNDFRSNKLEETGSLPDNYLDTARGAKQVDTNRRNTALSFAREKNEQTVNEFKNHDSAVSEFISTIFGMVRTIDGGVEISRNAGKNPVTVTFYGSSLQGIGDKFAREAISTINELSTVLINNNTNGVVDMEKAALDFFKDSSNRSLPKEEQVRLLHNLFVVMPEVTSKLKVYGVRKMEGTPYAFLKEEKSNFNVAQFWNGNWVINTDNLTNLRFPKQVMESLNGNMTEYLAAPLDTALNENAKSTLTATKVVKEVTNEYSKLVSEYFNSLLEEVKKEPEYDVHDGFSKKQVDRIIRKLDETGITYQVAGKKFTLVNRAGSAEGAKFESDANGRGGSVVTNKSGDPTEVDLASRIKDISELGVAGIPRFVISFGDGATINHFVNETAKQEITGYMQVFDGINLSADNYLELSQLANDSVLKAIQDRPLNGLVRMMEKALEIPEIAERSDDFKAMVQELKGVANRVNSNLDALNTMEYSIDQMAAVGKNAVNNGKKLSNNQEERRAELLEATSEILIERSKTRFKDMENVEATDKKNIDKVLKNALESFPKESRKLVRAIRSAFIKTGASINLGDDLQNSNYDLDTNTVNIQRTDGTINPRSLVHEMAHATITKTLQLVAQGKEVGKETRQAIRNLRTMFEEAATSKERYNNIIWDGAINHALKTKQSFLKSGFSLEEANAAMLDEFLITFMTTPQLVEASKEAKTKTFIRRMTKAAFDVVVEILGLKRATKDDSLYTGLIKSWAEISQAKISEPLNNSKVEMLDFGSSKVERDTVDAIKNLHSKLLPVEEVAAKGEILSSIDKSVSSLKTAGLLNTLEEQESFKAGALVIGLASGSDRKGVQGLYRMAVHAAKELEPSHFGDTSIPDTPAYYEAMNKYNAAMGVFTGGANTIVRNMMGLVYASPVMKEAINKIGIPKSIKGFDRDSSFERALGSLGYSAIHKLSNKLDGINGTVPSDVINTLIEGLAKKHKGGLANELLTLPSITYDKANDLVVQGLEHLSKNLDKVGKAVEGESKLSKSLGISIRAVGGIFNSDTASGVAEGVSSALNSSDSFVPLKEVIHDIIGRTDSNKRTYDLIKQVRSAVQRLRQMYVESTPTNIKKRFKKEVTERQWEELTDSMYKTDMAAIASVHGVSGALDLLNNKNKVKSRISELEESINRFEGDNTKRLEKAEQLAKYMITGKTGGNLLKNATEVAKLYGEKGKVATVPKELVEQLDEYISLLAFTGSIKTAFNTLSKMEREGMHFTLASLLGNRREEEAKSKTSNMLGFKGNTPSPFTGDIRVIRDSQADKYIKRGYRRVADYVGSELDTDRTRKGYYVSSLNSTRPFAQGIIQNAVKTVNGVDARSGASVTGRSIDINVTDKDLQKIKDRLKDDKSEFGLIPSYDEKGELIGVERPIDSAILNHVKLERSLPELIGIQRGRQIEEAVASSFNQVVVEQLELEYKESDKKDEFINILDPKSYENNAVIKDAVSILSKEALNYARNLNGRFMVKKELLNNVIGYRQLGVASLFDGVTNINDENRHLVVGALEALVGDKAYYYLVNGEEILRGLVHDVKKVIVVKSVIVPAINGLSNIVHLMGRGVPIKDIVTKIPKMIAELEQYTNAQKRLIEIETEILTAEGVSSKILKLETERDIIQARVTKLNIYPLIEAGEFASIVSAKIDQESTTLQRGKIAEYLEGEINKLDLSVRTFAKNVVLSEDTSIYQFLQKTVDYGDFVAKAIMFEDLVNRQNRSREYAIGKIREEFINYDFLPGRFRGMLEGMGLLWFFNFKMRSLKIALSMIRENPLHTIITMGVVPMGTPFGDLGIPIDDNVVYQIGEGTVDRSVGIGMGLRGYQLHPVSQLLF